jgi:signal transduction histidine kinase
MTSIEGKPTPSERSELGARSIHLAIEELRAPLTVIRGHGQLITRRMLQRPIGNQNDLLKSLAVIETAALALEARLRALADEASDPRQA